MKVFIAKGHGEGDPGAVAAGYNEHDLVRPIAEGMANTLKAAGVTVAFSEGVRDVPARIRVQASEANSFGADLALQIHLNSSDDSRAHGSEVWIWAPGGRRESWARKIAAELDSFIPSRGVKAGPYTFLRATAMPAAIVEAGFISNTGDRDLIIRRGALIGHRLALATLDQLGLPRPNQAPAPLYRIHADGQQVGAFRDIDKALVKIKELLASYKAVRILKGES